MRDKESLSKVDQGRKMQGKEGHTRAGNQLKVRVERRTDRKEGGIEEQCLIESNKGTDKHRGALRKRQ